MKPRVLLLGCAAFLQGCLFSHNASVQPSPGGGEYRLTFRDASTGEPALGYGYSIETGQTPLLPMLGLSYTGGPLDLRGSTEWTFEDDPTRIWSIHLEPPYPRENTRRQESYPFNVNRVFRKGGHRWPERFRIRDERTGKWELFAERIGAARY